MWIVYVARGTTPWLEERFVVGSVQQDGVEERRLGYERMGFLKVCGRVELSMIEDLGFLPHLAALRAELRETLDRMSAPGMGIRVVRGACFAKSQLTPDMYKAIDRLLREQPDLDRLKDRHHLAWLHCNCLCFKCERPWRPGHVCEPGPAAVAAPAPAPTHNPARFGSRELGVYWRNGGYWFYGEGNPRKPGRTPPFHFFRATKAGRHWLVYQSGRGGEGRSLCPGGPWAEEAEACEAAAALAMEAALEGRCRARRAYRWKRRST